MEADRRRAARRSDAVHYRIKDGYCVRDLCGDSLVIPIGREAINANQVALLSPTGQFIWDKLATVQTFGELVQAVLAEYDVCAADGMLFEYNDENNSGPQNVGATVVQPALRITTQSGGGAFIASAGDGYIRYTATSDGTYLTYSIAGNRTRTSIRYCVVSYRTNSAVKSGSTPTIGHRWNGGSSYDYKTFPQDGYNKDLSGSFYNVVVDLGSGNETVSYVTLYPRVPNGKIIDIAYIAFFSNKTDADNYAKNATGNNGKNYTGGNKMLPEKCSSCAKKILCPVCIAVTQSQNTVPDALCRYCDSYMAEFSAITRAET